MCHDMFQISEQFESGPVMSAQEGISNYENIAI